MVDVSTNDNTIGINVSSAGQKSSIGFVTPQSYYDGLAKQWAISESLVNNEDYSSKHYAEESKKQALISTSKATIATEKAQEVAERANEALAEITDQEETSKDAVKVEGDTQVARVQAEGANYATKAEATYTAGTGISIENNVISNTQTSAEWGNIEGNIESQTDLVEYIDSKSSSPLPLLTPLWSDHLIEDMSYLRADTFQWQSETAYSAAYSKLLSEYNNAKKTLYKYIDSSNAEYYLDTTTPAVGDEIYQGTPNVDMKATGAVTELLSPITGTTLVGCPTLNGAVVSDFSTEDYVDISQTVGEAVTQVKYSSSTLTLTNPAISVETPVYEQDGDITFLRTPAGFKIADSSQEEAILNKYNTEGIAWIYILDKTNTRFKLPRMKYKYMPNGITASVVGTNRALCLTDQVNNFGVFFDSASQLNCGTYFAKQGVGVSMSNAGTQPTKTAALGLATDPAYSHVIANVSEAMEAIDDFYLYFYVGEFTQSALAQTAGLNTELFNAKADVEDVQALNNSKVDKSSFITYETDWFDIAASGLYSFNLSGKPIANIDFGNIDVQLLGKVKTAQNGYVVGDIIYPQFANYVGNTSGQEFGSTIWFSGTTMSVRFGKDKSFVAAGPAGGEKYIYKANVQCKIRLKGWSL